MFAFSLFITFSLYVVPLPEVTVSAPNTQIVGQSIKLNSNVIAVVGITSRVDVMWFKGVNGFQLARFEGVTANYLNDSFLLYSFSYTIPLLSTADDGRVYQCEVVINTSPLVNATGSVILDVTGKMLTLSILCCLESSVHVYNTENSIYLTRLIISYV